MATSMEEIAIFSGPPEPVVERVPVKERSDFAKYLMRRASWGVLGVFVGWLMGASAAILSYALQTIL